MEALSFSNLTVGDDGRVSFGGLSSGLDFQTIVEGIITAKRIPIDSLETRITENSDKIAALQDLAGLLAGLKSAVADLRGAVTFGETGNVFAAKQVFASTSRSDGAAPSAAGNLLGVSAGTAAALGSHGLEVLRVASAHKVASNSFTSDATALSLSGAFEVTGGTGTATITVQATDTLRDIRDRVNNANTGTNGTGVTASIVQASSNQFILVLTADETGKAMAITDSGSVLSGLGISSTNGASFTNQLQAPQTARFTADGLIDLDRFESNFIASGTAALTTIASGAFDINVGADKVTVSFDNTDTLTTLVTKINTAITTAGAGNAVFDAGTAASAMIDGDGFRLVITDTSGAAMTLTDAGGLLAELGVDNDLVIERTGNTVSDLFNGVTLTLFQAEEGTTVKLDVEQDLGAAKTQVLALVEAYNAVQSSINRHGLVDSATGAVTEETGALFGSTLLGNVESQLSQLLVTKVAGVGDAFAILAQIGVTLVDRDQQDPLLESTLQVDEAILDKALLNNSDEVRRLFAFDFTSSDPRVSLLGFTGATTYDAAGYRINLNFDDRFHSQTFTDGGAFTQVDAQTGGPAGDGIGAITFDDSIVSGNAYRYSYDGATEQLTLVNLTAGTSQTIDITATLDGIGNGGDLDAGETAVIIFSTLEATITLSGDNGFTRATDIADGTLVTSGLHANTTMTNGAVTTPVSGMNEATVDALKAAGAYDAATGMLTLGVTSNAAGEVHFDLAAGIKFRVDGGSILSDITGLDLDDLGAHGVDLYVNDGAADVMVATISFDSLAATAAGGGSLTVDLGTGLLAETSTVASQNAPLENYLGGVVNGSFEVRDSTGALLGTVAYDKTESLTDLASAITANVTDVTASVIASGNTYKIEILHSSRDTLGFTADSGGLIAALNIANAGDGVFSANINGAATGIDDGSVTVSGRTLTATSLTKAEGLKVFYGGGVDLSGAQLDHTVGFGARLYFELDKMLDNSSGTVATGIDALGDRNTLHQARVDDMLARLELRRQNLLDRFVALEAALLAARNLRESLQQTFDAMFASQSS